MTRHWSWIALGVLAAAPLPSVSRESLVCRVTARVPYRAAISPDADSSRIFTQNATVLEERRSGSSIVRRWFVVADTPDQLVAVNADASLTLLVNRPGGSFSESGVEVQRRGYCRLNELP